MLPYWPWFFVRHVEDTRANSRQVTTVRKGRKMVVDSENIQVSGLWCNKLSHWSTYFSWPIRGQLYISRPLTELVTIYRLRKVVAMRTMMMRTARRRRNRRNESVTTRNARWPTPPLLMKKIMRYIKQQLLRPQQYLPPLLHADGLNGICGPFALLHVVGCFDYSWA